MEKAEAAETQPQVVDIDALIRNAATKHHLNYQKFHEVLSCESDHFKDVAIQSGYYKNGIRENSWGISQINLNAHPEVLKSQALDPAFAVEWAATQWEAGHAKAWSCY